MTATTTWMRNAISLGLLGLAAAGIGTTRLTVAENYADLERESEVYAMPQQDQLLVFSLGYRAALADLLFGRTMVAAGVHFAEKRVFHHLDAYLRGILALEPDFYDVYYYADSMLTLSTVVMPKENYRIARDILEQGMERFPNDAELWMNSGQFIAYLAPTRELPANENVNEWRAAGAKMIQHACDVWPADVPYPSSCVQSTRLLTENGEEEAAIRALERMLLIADDASRPDFEKVRAQAMTQLARLTNQRFARKRQEGLESLIRQQRVDLPGVSSSQYQLIAPPTDPDRCVGLRQPADRAICASSFARRRELLDQAVDRELDPQN